MAKKLECIEGIGPKSAAVLRKAGIKTVERLLTATSSRAGRKRLAEITQMTQSRLLQCANMADLFRISGVAGQYAELLTAAGVDTVKELKHRNVDNLVEKMNTINAEKKLVRSTPSANKVSSWIAQAKTLPPTITY